MNQVQLFFCLSLLLCFLKIGGFSIASSPSLLPRLVLAVKNSSHPPAAWVHNKSEGADGTPVEVQIGGSCTLLDHGEKRPAVFCAGGIGISPVLSQYREFLSRREKSQSNSPTMFLYSVSTQDELVFSDELDLLASETNKSLDRMVFTLTQSSTWEPKTNYKSAELKTGRLMKTFLDSAPRDSIFYICGPPTMLDQAVEHLKTTGISPDSIQYEKWW